MAEPWLGLLIDYTSNANLQEQYSRMNEVNKSHLEMEFGNEMKLRFIRQEEFPLRWVETREETILWIYIFIHF